MQDSIGLSEMLQKLLQVEDETWGLYAFSKELLNNRIQPEQKSEMIARAITCGREYARQIIRECGSADARSISDSLKLKLEYHDISMTGKRVLFARYTPPNKIEIMKEPIHQAVTLISEEAPFLVEHFREDGMMNIILGHEIFHFIEEQYVQKIYTRTEKILLWKFLSYKNYSTIRTLGEIGAMAFTKELNGLNYSPFIMDVLLFYGYDSSSAEKIYREVLANEVRRNKWIFDIQ